MGPAVLEAGEWELRLTPRSPAVSRVLPGDDGVVVLDVDLTSDLEAEGHARDVVRLVQMARREAGLRVTDRIALNLWAPHDVAEALVMHQAWIGEQVLASEVDVVGTEEIVPGGGGAGPPAPVEGALSDGRRVWLQIRPSGPRPD